MVKYSSNVGLRTGVAVGAVAIVVVAIVISKRRAHHMGGEAPMAAEVTGAVSPAVEGASAVPDVTKATATDEGRAAAVKRTE